MDDEESCPLCMEDLDMTDRNFRPCPCGYQVRRHARHAPAAQTQRDANAERAARARAAPL
jgi:CCR4-NOT transcription complex subunit 4